MPAFEPAKGIVKSDIPLEGHVIPTTVSTTLKQHTR